MAKSRPLRRKKDKKGRIYVLINGKKVYLNANVSKNKNTNRQIVNILLGDKRYMKKLPKKTRASSKSENSGKVLFQRPVVPQLINNTSGYTMPTSNHSKELNEILEHLKGFKAHLLKVNPDKQDHATQTNRAEDLPIPTPIPRPRPVPTPVSPIPTPSPVPPRPVSPIPTPRPVPPRPVSPIRPRPAPPRPVSPIRPPPIPPRPAPPRPVSPIRPPPIPPRPAPPIVPPRPINPRNAPPADVGTAPPLVHGPHGRVRYRPGLPIVKPENAPPANMSTAPPLVHGPHGRVRYRPGLPLKQVDYGPYGPPADIRTAPKKEEPVERLKYAPTKPKITPENAPPANEGTAPPLIHGPHGRVRYRPGLPLKQREEYEKAEKILGDHADKAIENMKAERILGDHADKAIENMKKKSHFDEDIIRKAHQLFEKKKKENQAKRDAEAERILGQHADRAIENLKEKHREKSAPSTPIQSIVPSDIATSRFDLTSPPKTQEIKEHHTPKKEKKEIREITADERRRKELVKKNKEDYINDYGVPHIPTYSDVAKHAAEEANLKKHEKKTENVHKELHENPPVLTHVHAGQGECAKIGNGKFSNWKKGLYDDQIEQIMHQGGHKKYVPVIMSDQIPEIAKYVTPKTREFGFVINNEDSSKSGQHWMACYVNKDRAEICFYDPLVSQPTKRFMHDIKQVVDRMHPDVYFKLKVNGVRDQNPKTNDCGFFSSKFLLDMFHGKKFRTATHFDDASGKGERMIEKFKQYI